MSILLPSEGAASAELSQKAHAWWIDAAIKSSIDLSLFEVSAPLPMRIAWARSIGLDIACVLSRYSTKLQHSTESQVQENLFYAARHGLYVPPEYICVDEAEKGRRQRRDGLDRAKLLLADKLATVLLVFKVSRLLRVGYKGFQFINEHVIEEGLRAISVSQGIDTNDEKTWKALMYLHGMMDDMLLDTIADHCRAALGSLFLEGYVTGALPVGYTGEIVSDGPLTNRGLPRRKPAIVELIQKLLIKHFEMARDGVPTVEGWRQWLAAGGPCDPRSTLGYMSLCAYRRMLSNPRYIGIWAFGRKRNQWSSKRDYTVQKDQPEIEVKIVRCEELRMFPDELFLAAQETLAKRKRGPRGPRKKKRAQLWDLVAQYYFCAACSKDDELVRFHQAGANGKGMRCKRGVLCPCQSTINREESVLAVLIGLEPYLARDVELMEQTSHVAAQRDAKGEEGLASDFETLERKVKSLSAKIDDLREMAGCGTEMDRAELKAKVIRAQADRAAHVSELARLRGSAPAAAERLTPDMARQILLDIRGLMHSAAAGRLDQEGVYKALSIFRRLVGERIMVHVERRPGRKQSNVRGTFSPRVLRTVLDSAKCPHLDYSTNLPEISVWLRKPPRLDLMADPARDLVDVQKVSLREAAKLLHKSGFPGVNSGNVWYSRRRWYEMRGLPVPDLPYNNGHRRHSK